MHSNINISIDININGQSYYLDLPIALHMLTHQRYHFSGNLHIYMVGKDIF